MVLDACVNDNRTQPTISFMCHASCQVVFLVVLPACACCLARKGVQQKPLLAVSLDVGSGAGELAKLSADKACVVIGVLGG